MSDILFTLIREKVFRDQEIQRISADGGRPRLWIFDFKSQGLSKVFLEEYARCFWDAFRSQYGSRVQIGGMETGAISLIAGVSLFAPSGIGVTGFYIRKSRKKSDLANLIEGDIFPDIPIILVDDILNFGSTIRKQIKILEDCGRTVSAVFVCLRFRDISFYQDLIDRGIVIVSIFELNDFRHVLPVANRVLEVRQESVERKYAPEYRVTLTKKPNLYLVVSKSTPLLIGEYIYMGVDGGYFYCLNSKDGSVVWEYRVAFGSRGKHILSSPSVYKDLVFFGAYDGNIYCLNRFTGKRVWVCIEADWVGSSPCVNEAQGIVYVGLEFGLFQRNGGLIALEAQTGRVKWKNYTMAGFTHASPAYSRKHNLVVCGCRDGYLYAFRANDGEIVWKFQTQGPIQSAAVFDEERDLVIFGSLDGGMYALRSKTGTLYHRFVARFGFYGSPALLGDCVVACSLDKNVYCFDLATKEVLWIFETAGRIFSSPTFDGTSVFVGSNDGRLYEIDMATGREISRIQLTERIVNRIRIEHELNGRRILYVPTHIGELYRFREIESSGRLVHRDHRLSCPVTRDDMNI